MDFSRWVNNNNGFLQNGDPNMHTNKIEGEWQHMKVRKKTELIVKNNLFYHSAGCLRLDRTACKNTWSCTSGSRSRKQQVLD